MLKPNDPKVKKLYEEFLKEESKFKELRKTFRQKVQELSKKK